MLKVYHSADEFLRGREALEARNAQLGSQVSTIIEQVRQKRDVALRELTSRFDHVALENIRVPLPVIEDATNQMDAEVKEIFKAAISNVRYFHEHQLPRGWTAENGDGSSLGMQYSPVARVGCYIPGGKAGYPSTAIMTVVPAQIAGVERIILVTPPGKDGMVNPLVLAVAGLLGIEEVYAIGGAQAIAALAYGTETVPKVHKIVGPGNAYVNEAKRQVFGVVGIDSLAGPTEVVILADDSANPDYVVRDMFAQAEHDTEAGAILLTTSEKLAGEVHQKIESLISGAARADLIKGALGNHGGIVLISDLNAGAELVNEMAPEHLQIMTENPEKILSKVKHAGAIFLGEFTPAVVGDYFAGSNHVLPTGQNAKFSSPLNVMDFVKFSSVVKYSKSKLKEHIPAISKFAELEGLINHKKSVECRNA